MMKNSRNSIQSYKKQALTLMIKEIMQTREEVHKLLIEASKDPNHPSNDGLKAHFEDRKRKLAEIQKSKVK